MSRRKRNIRALCDGIHGIALLLKAKSGKVNYPLAGDMLITLAHRIKRTTWRGNEKLSEHKATTRKKPSTKRGTKR